MKRRSQQVLLSLFPFAAGIALAHPAAAVSINPDGYGQVLLYPYYTARSTPAGTAYVTALSISNPTGRAKALRVRFLEGGAGVGGLNFNLFLGPNDVWTAGTIAVGSGGGIFTADHSCTSPTVSASALAPTPFRNIRYATDPLGDSLERTLEGYVEVLEMGTIEAGSALAAAVTPVPDPAAPNASRPTCAGLPVSDELPAGLIPPTGGLAGSLSLINVRSGTDFSVDAVALSQWSDKVQWTAPGAILPTLGSASPPVSLVVDHRGDADLAYVTTWAEGRDAVSALFMVSSVGADFTVESAIDGTTDWVLTMPTKRLYVGTDGAVRPFQGKLADTGACEPVGDSANAVSPATYDREGRPFARAVPPDDPVSGSLCFATNVASFTSGTIDASKPLQSVNLRPVSLAAPFVNGFARLALYNSALPNVHALPAPAGATSILNTRTGALTTGATVTYYGLPLFGFAAQSYSNGTLQVAGTNVASDYGTVFQLKYERRIEQGP